MTKCINLRTEFGDEFKIASEGNQSRRRVQVRSTDPWLLTIPCKHGHIYPHGGSHLAVSTNNRVPVANRLASLSCIRVVQDGDDGINAVFHLDDFGQVAAIVKPRRKRRLTTGQRDEQAARLRHYQFAPQVTTLARCGDAVRTKSRPGKPR